MPMPMTSTLDAESSLNRSVAVAGTAGAIEPGAQTSLKG